jgi:signal peptidase I
MTTESTVRKGRFLRDLASIASAAAVVLVARSSLADHYHVPSGSMLPTVHVGDHILVDKTAYGLRAPFVTSYLLENGGPGRGDVVVLESPETGVVLLKRVVALPGDRIAVRGGMLELNGTPVPIDDRGSDLLEELGPSAHSLALDAGGGPDFGPVVVPPRKYLVLGDNRGQSNDGRFFGWVDREAILGRAVRVLLREGAPMWLRL